MSDVASAFALLVLGGAEGPHNLGSDQAVAVKEVVEAIGDMMGAPERLQIGALAANTNDPPRLVADNSRLRSLGWSPKWPLRDGLDATIAWWRSQPGALGVAV
ncbi:hypothetical protein BH10PSE9_BH10PSE9_06070 [soil metagenome]